MKVQLLSFISILQLFAGIVLLFFYEDILKVVVFSQHRKRSIDLYKEIENHVQVQFQDADRGRLQDLIDFKKDDEGNYRYLQLYRNTVGFMGKLSCAFLLILMFLASHESETYSPIDYTWILFVDIFFLIICIWCGVAFVLRRHGMFMGYWRFLWGAVVLMVFGTVSFFWHIESICSNNIVVYWVLMSFILILLWSVLIFLFEEKRSRRVASRLECLRDHIVLYGAWAVDPNSGEAYRNMDKSFKRLFHPDSTLVDANMAVGQHVNSEFHIICNSNVLNQNWIKATKKILKELYIIICRYWKWLFVGLFILICIVTVK